MTDSARMDRLRRRPFSRTLWRLLWRLRLPLLKRRISTSTVERFDGLTVVVLPGVLNPVLFRSGVFLAQHIRDHHAACSSVPGGDGVATALDMGTGSGLGALVAACAGYDVVAVDINPDAVRCAGANAVLNGLDDRIEVIEGDVFDSLPAGARFDMVAFNPPFYRGAPRDPADMAWRGEGVLERFAAGLERVLTLGGVALVLLSTDGAEDSLAILQGSGLHVQSEAERDFGNEVMTVYAMTRLAETSDNGAIGSSDRGESQT